MENYDHSANLSFPDLPADVVFHLFSLLPRRKVLHIGITSKLGQQYMKDPKSFSALSFSAKEDFHLAKTITTTGAFDFIKSHHPSVTELDFRGLVLVDWSLILEQFVTLFPGHLKSLTCPLVYSLINIIKAHKAAFANLESFRSIASDNNAPTDASCVLKLCKLLPKLKSFSMDPKGFTLESSTVSQYEVDGPPATTEPTATARYSWRPQPTKKRDLPRIFSTQAAKLAPLFANLTSIQLQVTGPAFAVYLLSLMPKVQYAKLFLSSGEEYRIVGSEHETQLRQNKSLKILHIDADNPQRREFESLLELVSAVGSSLEDFHLKLNTCYWSDESPDTSEKRLELFFAELSILKRLYIQMPSLRFDTMLKALKSACPPSLEYLAVCAPGFNSNLTELANSIPSHIKRGGSLVVPNHGFKKQTGRCPAVREIYNVRGGVQEFELDPSATIPHDPDAPRAVCQHCQTFLPEIDLQDHLEVCFRRPLPCHNRGFGCQETFSSRHDLSTHFNLQCPHSVVHCHCCAEMIHASSWTSHMMVHREAPEAAYLQSIPVVHQRFRGPETAQFPWAKDLVLCLYCRKAEMPLAAMEAHLLECASLETQAAIQEGFSAPKATRCVTCMHASFPHNQADVDPKCKFAVLYHKLTDLPSAFVPHDERAAVVRFEVARNFWRAQ